MASITLKNIPEPLHLAYRRRAKLHGRSLQAEILHTLRQSAEVAQEEPLMRVDDLAGCIKPMKSHVSLEEMDRAVEVMFREGWKHDA